MKWFTVFSIKMLLIYTAFYIVYLAISAINGFYLVNVFEANIVYQIIKIFYPLVTINENILSGLVLSGQYSNFAVSIDDLCLGWFPITAFSSMILALPKIKKEKIIKCLQIGIPVLFVANILRIIIILFAAAAWGIKGFDFFHLWVVKFDLYPSG